MTTATIATTVPTAPETVAPKKARKVSTRTNGVIAASEVGVLAGLAYGVVGFQDSLLFASTGLGLTLTAIAGIVLMTMGIAVAVNRVLPSLEKGDSTKPLGSMQAAFTATGVAAFVAFPVLLIQHGLLSMLPALPALVTGFLVVMVWAVGKVADGSNIVAFNGGYVDLRSGPVGMGSKERAISVAKEYAEFHGLIAMTEEELAVIKADSAKGASAQA